MQELKPVAWSTEDRENDMSATTYRMEVALRWSAKGWPVDALYALPATHRIVSVELLEELVDITLTHSWHETAEELRAIIDKETP
jgi:hypothetical protein